MGIFLQLSRLCRRAVTPLLVIVAAGSAVFACDTPVYRYAMYRWLPAPYEVYYFHSGDLDEAGQKMKAALDELGEAEEARTNIVFLPVNLEKDKDLTGVPPDVKEAWQKQESPTIPSYLISSPVGAHLRLGQLTLEELPALVNSPKRQQVGELLGSGNAGVYIFLKGENKEANAEAEKVLRDVVSDVGAGKVELYSLPPTRGYGYGPPGEEDGEKEAEEESPYKLAVGLLTLARDEEKEKGLVDCLLALEPDLRDSKEPIVFMIYGRGRALFSCLGKGIHRDNLIQDIEFVTGACSCTVKEQNPGVDLLMAYDWDTAAEKLSSEYGAEEGSAYEFGGDALFPELMIPPEGDVADSSEETGEDTADTAVSPTDDVPASDASTGEDQTASTEEVTPEEPSTGSPAEEKSKSHGPGVVELTMNAPEPPPDGEGELVESEESSFKGMAWVGAGLLGALVVLFGATFLVLRPK